MRWTLSYRRQNDERALYALLRHPPVEEERSYAEDDQPDADPEVRCPVVVVGPEVYRDEDEEESNSDRHPGQDEPHGPVSMLPEPFRLTVTHEYTHSPTLARTAHSTQSDLREHLSRKRSNVMQLPFA